LALLLKASRGTATFLIVSRYKTKMVLWDWSLRESISVKSGLGSPSSEDGFGHRARNVLTYIDKLDKRMDGVRDTYEFMSEWCHPNGSGHLFTYGEINKSTGTLHFRKRRRG
jgi:hypothetical protein